jgi:hypothetical protein
MPRLHVRRTPMLPPAALWCSNNRAGASNRWNFPPAVGRLLRQETSGRSVLHLFGGMANFGTRIDIDPLVKPSVIADAWLPPFQRDSFQVVILDPPYHGINQQMKQLLIRGAAWIASEHVYWFHTQWVAADSHMQRERSWLIRVGDSCACRCLIEWRVDRERKILPRYPRGFSRGPAIKYNRWLFGNVGLPFAAEDPSP